MFNYSFQKQSLVYSLIFINGALFFPILGMKDKQKANRRRSKSESKIIEETELKEIKRRYTKSETPNNSILNQLLQRLNSALCDKKSPDYNKEIHVSTINQINEFMYKDVENFKPKKKNELSYLSFDGVDDSKQDENKE